MKKVCKLTHQALYICWLF